MLCVRKYRFALCFRVLSNQYVERSPYANVLKCYRKNKRFERAKVNSRCFRWFSAAMLESLRWAPTWCLHTKHYNFQWYPCRITWVQNITHPRNFGMLFIYNSSTISQFLDSIYWTVSNFIFHLRDVKTTIRIQVLCSRCTVILKIIARNFAFSYLQWPWMIFKDTFNVNKHWFYNIQLPKISSFFLC